MFGWEGYVWDVGVHEIGELGKSKDKHLLKYITNDKINWISLGNPYESFYFDYLDYNVPNSKK